MSLCILRTADTSNRRALHLFPASRLFLHRWRRNYLECHRHQESSLMETCYHSKTKTTKHQTNVLTMLRVETEEPQPRRQRRQTGGASGFLHELAARELQSRHGPHYQLPNPPAELTVPLFRQSTQPSRPRTTAISSGRVSAAADVPRSRRPGRPEHPRR